MQFICNCLLGAVGRRGASAFGWGGRDFVARYADNGYLGCSSPGLGVLAAAIWFVGFLALYAWILPVTYQHGRYVMPAMPIFFLLALAGMLDFCLKPV